MGIKLGAKINISSMSLRVCRSNYEVLQKLTAMQAIYAGTILYPCSAVLMKLESRRRRCSDRHNNYTERSYHSSHFTILIGSSHSKLGRFTAAQLNDTRFL